MTLTELRYIAVVALPFEEPGFAIEPVYDENFVVAVPWRPSSSSAAGAQARA